MNVVNIIFLIFLVAIFGQTVIKKSPQVRPRSRLKKGDGMIMGIVIGLLLGICISILFNHFVFIVIGLAFGHYIGLCIEVSACPSSSDEVVSYRKYSLAGTIAVISGAIYAALAIQ
ncbi:MAG: hypothetical protein APG12_01476 [Candidatus Methanofastidiosum methylothiophilum]|uniref:Zinc transporter ZupT n=1 Tax=Candidatus Methanofastidiosum methylothiophilum TaxID=1705564 RepID=A0A150IX52_9EURY|nr:MAG: hypothetical protein APG10_01226 [Candidatus Methanofastidiosum methylthiophilus]KYC47040.1 MAG: hypothetical protein APG11_01480 [Candidatus Methanofastidiosum methylthiophilus]KYC49455.1 MAG: hypothetical protein APG12_01476 [Candidatus Methanofastidiosum methylthiophilus]